MGSWQWIDYKPAVPQIRGAYISHYKNRRIQPDERSVYVARARRLIAGCVYDHEGLIVPCSERVGGFGGDHVVSQNATQIEVPSNAERLCGRTLFLGHHMDHYGHFLTEFLSRLWPKFDYSGFDHIVAYPFIFGNGIRSYHRDLVRRIVDFDLYSKITITHGNLLAESLTVPEPLIQINRAIHPAVSDVYRRAVAASANERGDVVSKRIFLSRSSQLKNQRIRNVSDVEAVFRQMSFDILYPEKMSISEQLRYYRGAKVFAGFSGSAMHNVVFTSPGSLLIEVGDPRAPKGFLKMQAMLNAASHVEAIKVPFTQSAPGDEVDLDQLSARLSSILKYAEGRVQA